MKGKLFALALAMGLAATAAHAETYNLTLTGASPGGAPRHFWVQL